MDHISPSSRPAPYTGGDALMDVELLIAVLEHCKWTGVTPTYDDFRPLIRESAVRDAWRILDRSRIEQQVNEIFPELPEEWV